MREVEEAFRRNFELGREVGAALCVFENGREVLSVHGGFRDARREVPWEEDTMVLVWSATKGPASACVLHAMEAAGAGLDTRVAEFWPEFGAAGKDGVTLGHAMSHQSGLCALDAAVDLLDREGVERALERQRPEFPVGRGPVYSPRLFGFLLDGIVRRLAGGEALGAYWRRVFAEPLGLDFWIGLPEELHGRVATMLPPKAGPPAEADREFLAAFQDIMSPTRRAFESPTGHRMPSAMNLPEVRSASLPALGGIGTARALAKFYAMLAGGGAWEGRRFFGAEALGWMSGRLAQGFDPVLRREMAFGAGFALDPVDAEGRKTRWVFGPSPGAFGHPGAGGSLGFADAERGLGFAYVINQMELGVLPHERCFSIVRALYGAGEFQR